MSRTVLSLAGRQYLLAHKDLIPTGGRQFSIDQKPWQQGDPAERQTAVWQTDGPGLFSYEETDEQNPAGYLGVEYGGDSRWTDTLVLPPLLSTLTLSGSDTPHPETLLDLSAQLDLNTGLDGAPVSGNVSAIVVSPDAAGATQYLYFARGNYVTKVNAATLAVVSNTSFLDTVTDLVATQTPSNTREVSAALQSSAYQVANPLATAAVDTWAANTAGEIARVFGKDPQRVVEGQLSLGVTNWRGNILAGAVTMLAPVWNTVASIVGGPQLIPTGFTTDGYRWVCATSSGPYVLDPLLGALYALLPSTDNNPEHGRNTSFWEFLGAIIPGRYGIRFQRANIGRSFGVETFEGNRSPVTGYPTAQDGSTRWHYEIVQNTATSTAYLVAFHPDPRETRPNRVMSPFVIGTIPASAVSRALRWVGTANQLRTTPVVVMGNGTNALSMLVGETPQEIDDTNYRYAASGTVYFTQLRRNQHALKDVESMEFETANCVADRTIGVAMTFSGDIGQPTTVTLAGTTAGVNDVISTNGYQRRLFVDNAGVPLTTATGRRLRPQLVFTTQQAAVYADSLTPAWTGVWKLGEASGSFLDTSGNGNSGTLQGTHGTRATAALDNGGDGSYTQSSTGGDTRISITDVAALRSIFAAGGTVWMIIQPASAGEAGGGRWCGKNSWMMWNENFVGGHVNLRFQKDFSVANGIWTAATAIHTTEKNYVGLNYNSDAVGNDPTIFVWNATHGLSVLTVGAGLTRDSTPIGVQTGDGAANLYIGDRAANDSSFDGIIDEFRVLKGAQRTQAQFSAWLLDAQTTYGSLSPQIIGPIVVHYVLRPIQVAEYTVYLQMTDFAGRTAYDQIQELLSINNAAPALVDDDWWGSTYYVRVMDVKVPPELQNLGGSNDRPRDGGEWVVPIVMRQWLTSGSGVTP